MVIDHKLTKEQENVLSNPNVLTTFLFLLDGRSTMDEIVRRTGFLPLECSAYLERMVEASLIRKLDQVSINNKNIQVMYEVVDQEIDLSSIVPILSTAVTLDLIYSKVKSDIANLESKETLMSNSEIKYAQVKVRSGSFERLKEMMQEMNDFIKTQEISDGDDGDDGVTVLLIGYKQ